MEVQSQLPNITHHKGSTLQAPVTEFTYEHELVILGTCLTADADAMAAVTSSLEKARKHWIQRRTQLCRKRVPLSKRIARYYDTVGLTALHGHEGLVITQEPAGNMGGIQKTTKSLAAPGACEDGNHGTFLQITGEAPLLARACCT
eukprot:3148180-Karenia_brevis.AAC.1